MKVVSWNMGCATKRYCKYQEEAWRYLIGLAPDIALVQEAMLDAPPFVSDGSHLFLRAAYQGQNWGSGVMVRINSATEQVIDSDGSYIVAADVSTTLQPLLAISVHVCPDNRQLKYLRALIDKIALLIEGRRFVLGGDFNAARHWDSVHKRDDYGWFFRELAARGLHDCHFGLHGYEVKSFWGPQALEPYQLDHFFVRDSDASLVRSCHILDNPDTRRLSDHGPIVLELG